MTRVLVPLADGVEEIEAVVIVDTLRRAGWEVLTAGIGPSPITASRGVKLVADTDWKSVDPDAFDVLLLPGGMGGTNRLMAEESLLATIRAYAEKDKLVGAICAAPLALQKAGILAGRRVTCHPGVRDELTVPQWVDERVVVDGRLVTSQGPGTAFEFAMAVITLVDGPGAARAVGGPMLLPSVS